MALLAALTEEARASRLVPFVGAGVSRSMRHRVTGEPLFPSWHEFVERLADGLAGDAEKRCREALATGDHVLAAGIAQESMTSPRWHRALRQSFDVPRDSIDEAALLLQSKVWEVSRGLVVTTNFDRSLVWAAPGDVRALGLEAPIVPTDVLDARPERPLVWHIHGKIEYPGTLVLSPPGYQLLYSDAGDVEARYEGALFVLRSLIATSSLLFVGFSLTDLAVVGELQRIHALFQEAHHSHYVTCRQAERAEIESRIVEAGLRNVELLVVADFGTPLIELLDQLTTPADAPALDHGWIVPAPAPVDRGRAAYLRRRCRTITAGSDDFRAAVLPTVAEHRRSASRLLLVEVLDREPALFERKAATALLNELDGAIERMAIAASDDDAMTAEERWNCRLLHCIALEKLGSVDDATENLRGLLSEALPPELRLCAEFNLAVCVEKSDPASIDFRAWISDKDVRISTGELVWTKAFNMELVRCSRVGATFEFADLLHDAIRAEMTEASSGFAKTILNWSLYSGEALQPGVADEVMRVAGGASVNARVAMLSNLRSFTRDETLLGAIDATLDSGIGTSLGSSTVARFVE